MESVIGRWKSAPALIKEILPGIIGLDKILAADVLDDVDGLSAEDVVEFMRCECSLQAPLDAQQLAEDQAEWWGKIWVVGKENDNTLKNLKAMNDSAISPELLMRELLLSLASFPNGTGLGGHRVHAKVLKRASGE